MLPVLFAANTTTWTSFGIGVLSDAISCEVEEHRNGAYELELQYPIDGMFYSEIALRTIILAKPNYTDTPQPFRVYAISKPINGIVTVSAQHISYDLSGYVDAPFTADGISNALTAMLSSANIYPTSCPFTFATDISSAQSMAPKYPASVRALMGGIEGSLIDIYGGEWHFNGLTCTLKAARGTNRGVEIRYGKNMTDLRQEENNAAVYTAVYPYYYNADNNDLVTLTEKVIAVTGTFDYSRVLPLDLTSEFGEKPSESQLRTRATSYITENNIGVPKVNLTISFANQDSIQDRVDLCDTVTVKFDALGVSASAKCIRTKWDVLKERYIEAELGSARNSLAATIAKTSEIEQEIKEHSSQFKAIAGKIASVVTGNTGGYIMLHDTNNDGNPDELLILNTDSISTATYVIRINNAGIAFSSTGYNGTYTTAWNINGQFSANFIASGSIATDQVTILGDTQFKWDASGISMTDPSDTNKIIRLGKYDGTHYGLGFSLDGGTTWKSGFDFTGISLIGETSGSGRAKMTGTNFYIINNNGLSITDIGEGECHDIDGNTLTAGTRYRIGSFLGTDSDQTTYTAAEAHGEFCFSGGRGNLPAGIACVCIGYFSKAFGNYSISIGRSCITRSTDIAIGYQSEASSSDSSRSSSYPAIAIGKSSKALDVDTIAIGNSSESHLSGGIAIGKSNTNKGTNCIGIGQSNTVESNDLENYIPNKNIAVGNDNVISVTNSILSNNIAIGDSNFAKAAGPCENNILIGESNEAGSDNSVEVSDAIFIGHDNSTNRGRAIAIGHNNTAESNGIAIGDNNDVNGMYNNVIGSSSSFGSSCQYSTIIGDHCEDTSYNHCFLAGYRLSVNSAFCTVLGRCNYPDNKILIIGNGSYDSRTQTVTRGNALTLANNGNLVISGTLAQGSDARLKTVLGEAPDLSGVRAVRFKWNEKKLHENEQEHIGYIAQDVEAVAPYLVQEDAAGYKSLDYIGLLCAKVEKLEQTVMQLMQRIIVLEGATNAT